MSARPTLLSLTLAVLIISLAAVAALYTQCFAEPPVGGITRALADQAKTSQSGTSPSKTELAVVTPSAKSALTPAAKTAPALKTAPAPAAAAPATAVTANVPPVDKGPAAVAAAKEADKKPYQWIAARNDGAIKLRGSVPSEEYRRTILGIVKAHFPDLSIDDNQKVAPGAPPKEQWLGAVSFALKELSHLAHGRVELDDVDLTINGTAKSSQDYQRLRKNLFGPLPTGLTVEATAIKPPLANPFVFEADLKANVLTLSGDIPSEKVHKRFQALVKEIFGEAIMNDKLVLASGEPKKWSAAAIAALSALSMLDEGKVVLSGGTVTISGTAPDKSTANEISYQLRHELPSVFSSSENIRWREAEVQTDVAKKIIPRIKRIVDSDGMALERILPSLQTGSTH